MARLQSGVSPFTNGQTLSATDLNNHVTGASPLPDFIGLQTSLTTTASADELLINDVSDTAVKKITVENLVSNLPATTVSALTVNNNASIAGNLTISANATIGQSNATSATFNSVCSFGESVAFNAGTTFQGNIVTGLGAASGTYTRSGTTITVLSVGHTLLIGQGAWFNIENNTAISGSYTVTDVTGSFFTITVPDSGATSGNISWYGNTLDIKSSLYGTMQGDIVVNFAKTNAANGDEFLIKDASDSNKLKTVPFVALPRLYGNVSIKSSATTTVGATVSRTSGSGTATVTKASHGLRVGDVLYLKLTGTGTLANGWYDVKSVPTSSTFTIQTANTTALASVALEWYALAVTNSIGIYSAFKESTTGSDVIFNVTTEFANSNYAIIATFSRDDGVTYGATCCNIIGATGFDKTTKQFSLTSNYTSTVESDGSMMFTVFGDI